MLRVEPAALRQVLVLTALLAVLVACRGAGSGRAGKKAGPVSSSTALGSAPPPPPALPADSRAAVRDNSTLGPFSDGTALELRALVSRLTTKDRIGLALRLRPETAPGKGAWSKETLDWTKVVPTLRFEVKAPSGKTHVLEVAEATAGSTPWSLASFMQTLSFDGAGLAQGTALRAWKKPVPGLLAAPGTYTLTLSGSFETNQRTLALVSGPLSITVVAPSDTDQPLAELERAAAELARVTWGAAGNPTPSHPSIDDVDGFVSVRFRQSGVKGVPSRPGDTGYDDDILEVWLDRAGKTLAVDGYRHFTCVAEGTLVATPRGPTPIEQLAVGAEVDSFDVVTRTRSVGIVVRTEKSYAGSLRQLGALRVTAEHPVWADGSWRRAGDIPAGAMLLGVDLGAIAAVPVALDAPATVYDLTVTPPSTYFAGGVLVHNKAAHVPLGGARQWGPLFYRRAARP